MVDIPQEVNQQALYGLIKRLTRIQKFFSEGDVFSLKEEKESEESKIKTNEKQSPVKSWNQSLFSPIKQSRELAIKEMRFYLTSSLEQRKKRAEDLRIPFKWYPSKISEIRKKFNFSEKDLGLKTLFLKEK